MTLDAPPPPRKGDLTVSSGPPARAWKPGDEYEPGPIETFYQRVEAALVVPFYLDRDLNVIACQKSGNKKEIISAPLLVTDLIRSSTGHEAYLRIEFLLDNGQIKQCDIPNHDLSASMPAGITILRRHGLYMPASAREMASLLRKFRPRVLDGADLPAGWHPSDMPLFGLRDGRAIAPDVITTDKEPPFVCRYRDPDSLERWRNEVAQFASDNPYVLFCLCLALTGPVLKLLGNRPGIGFNLSAPTSSGKTTVAKMMAGIWPDLQVEGWLHSDAGLEGACLLASDSLLILDELPALRIKDVTQTIYNIANGRPRQVRRDRDLSANETRPRDWAMPFFSTSEKPFSVLASNTKYTAGGTSVRMIDIVPDKLWQSPNGQKSTYDLIKKIEKALLTTNGVAGPEFVAKLIERWSNIKDIGPKYFELAVNSLKKEIYPNQVEISGAEMRRLEAFICVQFAGDLAARKNILPQTVAEVQAAVLKVAKEQLTPQIAANARQEFQPAIENLREWLGKNAGARLSEIDEFGNLVGKPRIAAGWRTDDTYFLLSSTMQAATGRSSGMTPLMNYLLEIGVLRRSNQKKSFQTRMGSSIHGRPWAYAIDRKALEAPVREE